MIKLFYNKLLDLSKDELMRGSFVLIFLMGIFNVLNYVFQISMARMLGPIDYGVLATLMSIIYIFGIPSEAIQTIISKKTSKLNVENKLGAMKDLLIKTIKVSLLFSGVIFLLFIFVSLFLKGVLGIDFGLLFITGFIIILYFTIPIIRGIMQGRKNFWFLGMNLISDSLIKVIFALFLVFAGFRVYGAIVAVIIASLIAFLLSLIKIKEVLKSKREQLEQRSISYNFNIPMFIGIAAIVLIYSLDIIIAKSIFPDELAGQYAFVSLIAKVILFFNLAVGKAMFPIISEGFERGESTRKILKKSLGILAISSLVALVFYYFIPELVIFIISLGSKEYLNNANILFVLGVAFSFISFSNILLLYGFSTERVKSSAYYLFLFVLAQIVFLSVSKSLINFSYSLLLVSFCLLIFTILITKKWKK